MLKPASGNTEAAHAIEQRFTRDFRVRRQVVLQWLRFLADNHPDYQHMVLSMDNMNAVPDDGSIHHNLLIREVEERITNDPNGLSNDIPNENNEVEDPVPRAVVVPDLTSEQTEMEHLRRDVLPAPRSLSVPSFRGTPVSEWENKCLFRMAFPSLFPRGEGDFYLPRDQDIKLADWIRHLLRYKDDRFARHSRFRYVAFNILMRKPTATRRMREDDAAFRQHQYVL